MHPVAVFVDIHLSKNECGLDIIPELKRTWPSAPIIVMTSDDKESLIAQALAAGAHDFIVKPLRPVEVVARMNARREELESRNNVKLLEYGDLRLDLQHKIISGPKGQSFQSPRELEILAHLMRANGSVIAKDSLKRHAWGKVSVSDNALDRKLFEIRKSVRSVSDLVEIKSIYGKGILMRLTTHNEDQIEFIDKQVALNSL